MNNISYLIIEIFNLPLVCDVCTIQLSFRIDICFLFLFFKRCGSSTSILSDICKRALGKLDAARVSLNAEIIAYSQYNTCIIFIILDNPSLKMQVVIFAAMLIYFFATWRCFRSERPHSRVNENPRFLHVLSDTVIPLCPFIDSFFSSAAFLMHFELTLILYTYRTQKL